jgi:hypothetical protein
MNKERFPRCEPGEEVLAPAVYSGDRLSCEPCREARRERASQVGTPQQHAHDAGAAHRTFERAAHGFDFG